MANHLLTWRIEHPSTNARSNVPFELGPATTSFEQPNPYHGLTDVPSKANPKTVTKPQTAEASDPCKPTQKKGTLPTETANLHRPPNPSGCFPLTATDARARCGRVVAAFPRRAPPALPRAPATRPGAASLLRHRAFWKKDRCVFLHGE